MNFFKNILCITMMMCLFALPQINHAAPLILDKAEIASAPLTGGLVVIFSNREAMEVDLPLSPEVASVTVQILNDRGNNIYTHRTGGYTVIVPRIVLESGEALTLVVRQAGFIIVTQNIPT